MKKIIFILMLFVATAEAQYSVEYIDSVATISPNRPVATISLGKQWQVVTISFHNISATDSIRVSNIVPNMHANHTRDTIAVNLTNLKTFTEVENGNIVGYSTPTEFLINSPIIDRICIRAVNSPGNGTLYFRIRGLKYR